MPRAPRSSLAADEAGSHPLRGQVGLVRLAVIGLIARGFTGAAIYQGWQLRAVMHIAGVVLTRTINSESASSTLWAL